MKILALGDVVGKWGRVAIKQHVPLLRQHHHLDFVMANGENMAGGTGMTPDTLDELFASGVDVITSGNHVWKLRDVYDRLERDMRVLRPANYPDYPRKTPGRGVTVLSVPCGSQTYDVAVVNLQGTTFMEPLPCPFQAAMQIFEKLDTEFPHVKVRLVDFHAEASSEKKCMGFALDGRASAVLGTHTHVQTADAQILPKGTAYLTDLGMCGVECSALGVDKDSVLERFFTRRAVTFKPGKGTPAINGSILDIDEQSGLARSIALVRLDTPPNTRDWG